MPITREITNHLDHQHLYGDLNHFDFQGNAANQKKYKEAEVVLNKILKKTTINNKDFNIKIFATLEQHASFLNNEHDFVGMLSTFNYEEEILDISLPDLKTKELILNSPNKTEEYDDLKNEIIKHIKQLIADKQSTEEVFLECNEEVKKEIPQNQRVGKPPANDNNNEVDELNKKYIKRNDDLHQVRVFYKKGQAEQTRHIVFGNEILKKESTGDSHEETAKKMVDLYSQEKEEEEEKRLIAKERGGVGEILDSVDYEKKNGIITGANVCYSQATTNAIADILTQNPDKDDFITKTTTYRTAIYILIPGSNEDGKPRQYAKYQLTPNKNNKNELVFEMEEKSFTREGRKFKESGTKIKEDDQKKVPPADKFQIYKTDKEQKQSLWNVKKPENFVAPTKVKAKQAQNEK